MTDAVEVHTLREAGILITGVKRDVSDVRHEVRSLRGLIVMTLLTSIGSLLTVIGNRIP